MNHDHLLLKNAQMIVFVNREAIYKLDSEADSANLLS